jgi:hypothetical protein
MKKHATIKPNLGFSPGHARGILTQIGSGPIAEGDDGSLSTELTDVQVRMFRLKAPMHAIAVDADAPAESPESAIIAALRAEVASFQVDIDGLVLCIDEWKKATGVDTPAQFAQEFEAKEKAKK